MSDADKQVVRRIYDEVFGAGDMAVVDEVISEDALDHSPPPFPTENTREGLKRFTEVMRAGFPDVRFVIHDMVSEADKVAVYYTMEGTHQGEFMGIAATGARVSMEGFDLIRVRDGRCTEHWGVQDNAGMLQQLGVMPPP